MNGMIAIELHELSAARCAAAERTLTDFLGTTDYADYSDLYGF
jgi:hypothetical protein